jgi:hypothetical protein
LCPGEQALPVPEQLDKILQTVHAGNFMGHVSELKDFSALEIPSSTLRQNSLG